VRAVLAQIEKLGKVWGESLVKGEVESPQDDDDAGSLALADGSTSTVPALAAAYLSRFPTGTRVEARVHCTSIIEEFFPLTEDVRSLLRVLHIPATSSDAYLVESAFQRELLDPSFRTAADRLHRDGRRRGQTFGVSGMEADELERVSIDDVVGLLDMPDNNVPAALHRITAASTGAAAGTVAVNRWHSATALQLSVLPVSVHAVVTQIAGIAGVLSTELRGRGLCAALTPTERLGSALLMLACGFTSHGLLSRARILMAEQPADTCRYAAAAGCTYIPDAVALASGDVGSDVDCVSPWLRRHICDHRDRDSASESGSLARVEVCDVHGLTDTTAEYINVLASWRVKEPSGKKYGLTSGRLRTTAKAVHVTGNTLMLWWLCAPSGGVVAGACFTRAEALMRTWQGFHLDVRRALAAHSAAGCRVVVAPDGATYRCVCELSTQGGGLGHGHGSRGGSSAGTRIPDSTDTAELEERCNDSRELFTVAHLQRPGLRFGVPWDQPAAHRSAVVPLPPVQTIAVVSLVGNSSCLRLPRVRFAATVTVRM
jgi:hypothetical protein